MLVTKSAEAWRKLDACRKQAQAAPTPALAEPPTEDPMEEAEATPQPPTPIPPPLPTPRNGQEDNGGCRDGDERWIEYDGPHPFTVPVEDAVVRIGLVYIAGTRRGSRLGSLDRAPFVHLDGKGQADTIPFWAFEDLSEADITNAFSGPGGAQAGWDVVGAGAVQQMTINLSIEKRKAMAVCERKEVYVNGTWEQRNERRSRTESELETMTEQITVSGNVRAGMARDEVDYLNEIVAFFRKVQVQVRQLRQEKERLDAYLKDCAAGRR